MAKMTKALARTLIEQATGRFFDQNPRRRSITNEELADSLAELICPQDLRELCRVANARCDCGGYTDPEKCWAVLFDAFEKLEE